MAFIAVVEAIAHSHYEVVFVAVAEKGVVGGNLVEEIVGAFRQIHVVDVYRGECVPVAVEAFRPFVAPSGSGDDAGVFRSLLIIHRHVQFGCRLDAAFETLTEEWSLEFRKVNTCFRAEFKIAVMYESAEVPAE